MLMRKTLKTPFHVDSIVLQYKKRLFLQLFVHVLYLTFQVVNRTIYNNFH